MSLSTVPPSTRASTDPSARLPHGWRAERHPPVNAPEIRPCASLLWGRQGSNLRPRDYESPALTTELRPREVVQHSSGGETRTLNPAVNSRMLCQLSYPGPTPER